MAVFTKIDRRSLELFLQDYSLGSLIDFKGIVQGVENTNYYVQTEKKKYVLTIFENRTRIGDLNFIFDFCNSLAEQGIICPKALPNKSGVRINQIMGKPASIVTFLEGKQVEPQDIKLDHLHNLGTMMAKMHWHAMDLPQKRENPVGYDFWQDMARECGSKVDMIAKGLSDIIQDELAFLKAHWPSGLPTATVHADMFPDNVFFDGTHPCGVIDFYFSCTTFMAYDIAIVIGAWCYDQEHNFVPERFHALMDGYQKIRGLENIEWQALPILCRAQALRFLMTRLYDWIYHPDEGEVVPKDPKEYIKKLLFHRECPDAVRIKPKNKMVS